VGPTLVAMATKFGLGTEIQSPISLSFYHCTYFILCHRVQSMWLLVQVLSSTNGDLLADEIVNDSPNPQLATPVDVEIVEETKYDLIIIVALMLDCRQAFYCDI